MHRNPTPAGRQGLKSRARLCAHWTGRAASSSSDDSGSGEDEGGKGEEGGRLMGTGGRGAVAWETKRSAVTRKSLL